MTMPAIAMGLHAIIVAMGDGEPLVLCVPGGSGDPAIPALPSGPFDPTRDRTLESGLRRWVREQTDLSLGYVEQLYTFGDRGRQQAASLSDTHFVSVGYLALSPLPGDPDRHAWRSWYAHLPWEDWRHGRPSMIETEIRPALLNWAAENDADGQRIQRLCQAFGETFTASNWADEGWDEERVLERYELIYEAGLVAEAVTDGRRDTVRSTQPLGLAMLHDHRRMLATGIARLRAKLKYRPVIFELMPRTFTLTQLQRTAEVLSGRNLHKQNFRRMVESSRLVEPTGKRMSQTGGRPAMLYRFRKAVTQRHAYVGLRV